MRAVVSRDSLAAVLAQVVGLVEKRVTIPVLSCARLTIGDVLTVTTSDLDAWISGTADVDAPEPWSGCIDANALHALVASLAADSDVTLAGDDARLTVTGSGATARFRVVPADEFPIISAALTGETTASFEIEAAALAAACRFVEPSAGDEEARYYLMGANVDPAGLVISTDGNRLATYRLPIDLPAIPDSVIVPKLILKLLPSLLRSSAVTIAVTVSPRAITFDTAAWSLTSKLINGTYPNWRRVIPERVARPMVVEAAALRCAVDRIAAVCGDGLKTRAARLQRDGDELSVSAVADQADDAEVSTIMPVEGGAGPLHVGLSTKYLASALRVTEAERIELHVTGPATIVWVCAAGEAETGVAIIPMRV